MLESELHKTSPNDKHKVTLYISSDVRTKLKIYSATIDRPMSEVAEAAITFYLTHPDIVEAQGHGHVHQLHHCPDCHTPSVFREGQLVPVSSGQPQVKAEDLSLCN